MTGDAVGERSFINRDCGHSVLNRDAGAVENDDFILGAAARLATGNDFAQN